MTETDLESVTDPTLAGLLAGVLTAPEDDVARLIFADRLDELGDHERAEFIRVQVELAKATNGTYFRHLHKDPCECDGCALRRRERELMPQIPRWFPEVSFASNTGETFYSIGGGACVPCVYRRGFIESVSCDLATFIGGPCERCEGGAALTSCEWLSAEKCPVCSDAGRTPGIAPRLFASQPVRQITLSDVRPMRHRILAGHRYGYELRDDNARDAWQLPAELFRHLPKADFFVNDYRRWWWTEEDALDALSVALVAYGRANAEGHRHGVCGTCKGEKRTDYWGPCPDCDATGTKPGLPPLRPSPTLSDPLRPYSSGGLRCP